MRRRFSERKTNYVFWSRAVAVGAVLFPLSLSKVDFRSTFSFGVSVTVRKSSPAYAAFEDLRENFTNEFSTLPEPQMILSAGKQLNMNPSQKVPTVRLLAMKGMTLHRPPEYQPRPYYVAGQSVRANTSASAANLREIAKRDIPLVERKRQLVEVLRNEDDWTIPSASQKALELAQAEVRDNPVGNERILRSSTGNPIMIRRTMNNDAPPAQQPPPPPMSYAQDNKRIDVATVTPPPPPPDLEDTAGYRAGLTTRNPAPGDMRPLWLTGQIEMTDGLAFLGAETHMVVRRTFNGENFESGQIWVKEGRFEIHVKRPMGFLVAELQTRDGRVMGRGEISLLDLKDLSQKDNRVAGLRIALHPTTEGASVHAVSGYSYGAQKIPVADARVEIQAFSDPQKVNGEGVVSEPNLSHDSSFVARAVAKQHWSSLIVGQADIPQDIRLFSNNLVDALVNLNLSGMDRKEAYQQSIVWGQISRDGKPVEGAQVEMAGNYVPIYFSEMYEPQTSLKGTSKNGLFAFVRVRAGVQAVRVKIGSKIYPAQVFPTENKHVSYVEVAIRDKMISQFKVFDGFDMSKPVRASVRLVGTEDTLPVGKEDFVEYSVAANPFMVEADGGNEYEVTRVTMTGSPHVVQIPLVSREWMYQVAREKNIVPSQQLGTVVGYIDNHDFEVELTGYAPGHSMQIVYFDAHGKTLESRTGVAGGGFIIFNAPQGLQTLYVHPVQSRETFSQVIVAEPQFVQVITH